MNNEKKKIIAVDDSLLYLNVLKKTLKNTYEVYPCPSAPEMFSLLEHIQPDLILLDANMPGMDGYEAIKKLKGDTQYSDIPVIFLTSMTEEQSELDGLSLGAVDYIHKPFVLPLLLQRIKIHLSIMEQKREILDRNKEIEELLELKIREVGLREAAELEARNALRAKSEFLANMSHEIRTPLNVIIGLTDLILEDEHLEKQVTENLSKISSAGTTLLSIVNDILDFSKIESGKLELTPVEYHMSSLLNDIVTLVITRLGEKPITFSLNISDDLPSKLYGDDLRVKQILTNLLTNSVKYTKQGSIELNVRCTLDGGTMWMDIAVKDTGIGIREEDLIKRFSDYNQVDTKANRNIEGTGLGLSITKRLTEMMDGKIRAESEYGKGSTFHVRLRQDLVKDAPPIGADVADKLRSFRYADDKRIISKKLVRLNLSYARVLVVDDMQTNLDVASGLLSKYKMKVDCVTSGQEAIEKIRDGIMVYNAIFMDHMMPGMDGIETADRIRALGTEYAQKVPIIALTANAIQGTDKMFYEHGFQAFTTKPIDVMELDSVIRKWVRDEKRQEVMITDDSSSSENIVINIPGVDSEKGLSLYAGDTKVYLPMLRSYIANTPGVLEKLRNVSAETLPGYVISVHGLKGTSAGIGAEKIREAAMELEAISRTGDLQGVLKLNGDLIANAEIVVTNVKEWLEKNDSREVKPRQKAPDRELLARLRQCFESYDMGGIDNVMLELERFDYEEGADLMAWLREKIETAEFDEAAERITQYEDGSGK
jgi:signal transduction histidine kinase/HPt (histidine-containing phosphotransfer) domain-containing protein